MKKKIIAYVVSAVMVLTMIPATAFAATDADGSGMSKTAPDALAEAQGKQLAALEKINVLEYDSTNGATVQGYLDTYIQKVNDATTAGDANAAGIEGLALIDNVEKASETINAYYKVKPSATESTTVTYYGQSDYDAADWQKISDLKAAAVKALGDVTSNAEVDVIISELKADIDAVPTDDDADVDELASKKAEYTANLDNYIAKCVYPGATYESDIQIQIDDAISTGKKRIEAVKATVTSNGLTELDNVYNDVIATLDTLTDNVTEGQKAFWEALEKAIKNDTETATGTSYQYANPNLYADPYDDTVTAALNRLKCTGDTDNWFYGMAAYDPARNYGGTDKGIDNYNNFVRTGKEFNVAFEEPTIENIESIQAEIKAYIALIPQVTNKKAVVDKWLDDVSKAKSSDSYESLAALNDQYKIIENEKGVQTAYTKTLTPVLKKYDDVQQQRINGMVETLESITKVGTSTDVVNGDNYIKVRDQYEAIEKACEKTFEGATVTYKGNYSTLTRRIESQENLIAVFIQKVYNGETYEIPTAEVMSKYGFVWTSALSTKVDAAKAAYVDNDGKAIITETMKSDPDADKYNPKDITLAKAIEVYEEALNARDAAKTAVDAFILSVNRLPATAYINIADKAAIDAAYAAYENLPWDKTDSNIASAYNSLKAAAGALVTDYAKAAEAEFTKASASTTPAWKALTADLVSTYEEIGDMSKDYGVTAPTMTKFDAAVKDYNGTIADKNNPVATANAASAVAVIIKNIPNDPANATEDDFAAVKQARTAYNALLTTAAKDAFKASGYLKWLEKYETAMGISEEKYDLANASVEMLGPSIEGGYNYIERGETPELTVYDSEGEVVPESAYTVDCNEAHPAGKTALIIRANAESGYTGEIEYAYVVVNGKKSIKSLTGGSKSFTVKYSDYSKHGCTGTEIAWKTSKNGEWKFSKITSSKASKKIAVKKAGKKYVRVRAIVKVDGIRYYSEWSNTKTVTVK